ncbi:PAS domain-containing protein [Hyunsoonleella sp. SJ7]|uniref:PAS domain-containing protein n=1 Tax=Hyunsoonleella aquatilis TaxID=2762758 RepID=A0A923H8Z4_9FLAO|nr:LuxR C-terminal-related transcriptional regulator [Hyunsoonleella aquatilis]MBC3758815.1 PAS domain-containing protein [Hyunsoonleella aquatilis]
MAKPNKDFIKETNSELNGAPHPPTDFSSINNFPLNLKQCLYVVDWQDGKISFCKNTKRVLGYNNKEFNLETLLNIAHPEDLEHIRRITQAVVNHLTKSTHLDLQCSTFNITYRFRKKDNTYVKILRQSSIFERTELGQMKSNLSILTDISFFDKSDSIKWELDIPGMNPADFKKEIYNEYLGFFTNREIEIIKLIADGFNTKSMAKQLFISTHTVYSHRKNILKKSNCHNSKELIEFCLKIGVL